MEWQSAVEITVSCSCCCTLFRSIIIYLLLLNFDFHSLRAHPILRAYVCVRALSFSFSICLISSRILIELSKNHDEKVISLYFLNKWNAKRQRTTITTTITTTHWFDSPFRPKYNEKRSSRLQSRIRQRIEHGFYLLRINNARTRNSKATNSTNKNSRWLKMM